MSLNAQSLDALLALLERERQCRDQAQLGLRDAQSVAERAHSQAQTLTDYRSEYAERWTGRFRTQGRIELVQCYQGFVTRLGQASTPQADFLHQQIENHRASMCLQLDDILAGKRVGFREE